MIVTMRVTVLTMVFAVLVPMVLLAGVQVTMDSESVGGETSDSSTMTVVIEGDDLRLDLPTTAGDDQQSLVILYRADVGVVGLVRHEKRVYIELDRETFESVVKDLDAVRGKIDELLQKVPEEQRQRAALRLREGVEPRSEIVLEAVDGNETVGSWSCRSWRVIRDGVIVQELATTEAEELGIGPAEAAVMIGFSNLFTDVTAELGAGFGRLLRNIPFLALDDPTQWPVQTRFVQDGQVFRQVTVTDVRRVETDASTFAVPPDYEKRNPLEGIRERLATSQ